MTLEEIIAERPDFGFAFYAYAPGEPVTLEIHAPGGDMFSFTGRDLNDVLEQAFGPFDAPAGPQAASPASASVFD